MRASGGTNFGLLFSVVVFTNSTIAFLAAPSFQDGSWSGCASTRTTISKNKNPASTILFVTACFMETFFTLITLLLGLVESLVETANVESASGLQIPFFEFLRSSAERAELVHSRARGREGKRLKRFGEHFVEVIPGGGPGADVRTEMLAGLVRNERRHVFDQERVEGGVVVRRGEPGHGSGLHRERRHGGNQFLLQLEQCRGRLYDNARKANILARDVVVFEALQLHPGNVGASEDLFVGGIDLVEVLRADEPLNQRNVRTACLIQGESLRADV